MIVHWYKWSLIFGSKRTIDGCTYIGQFSYLPIDIFCVWWLQVWMNDSSPWKNWKDVCTDEQFRFWVVIGKRIFIINRSAKTWKWKSACLVFFEKNFSNSSILIGLLSMCINRILLISAYFVIQIIPNLSMFIWRFV